MSAKVKSKFLVSCLDRLTFTDKMVIIIKVFYCFAKGGDFMKFKKTAAFFCAAALSLTAMSVTAFADGGVAIDEENFPDEKFRAYVSENCDTDEDGNLSDEEISAVKEINCSSLGIAYLDGIENFTALEKLDCRENKELYWFDISKNTALKELFCNGCEDYYIKRLACDDDDYSGGSGYYTLSLDKTTALLANAANEESKLDDLSEADVSSAVNNGPFVIEEISLPDNMSNNDGEKFPTRTVVGIAIAGTAAVVAAVAGVALAVSKKRK